MWSVDERSGSFLGLTSVLPDSGASCSVAPPSWMQTLHPCPVLRQASKRLVGAGGLPLNVLGAVDLEIRFNGKTTGHETVYICSGLSHFLLSLRPCLALGMIQSSFPFPQSLVSKACQTVNPIDTFVTSVAEFQEPVVYPDIPLAALDLLKELCQSSWPEEPSPELLKSLEEKIREILFICRQSSAVLPLMSGPPLKIVLTDDAEPYCHPYPHPMLLAQRDEVKRMLFKMFLCKSLPHGVTLNPNKFVFAKAEVSFVGYRLNSDGIAMDRAQLGLLELRKTPGEVGRSPSQIVSGRATRASLPVIKTLLSRSDLANMHEVMRSISDIKKKYHDQMTISLPPIPLQALVRIQDNSTRLWPWTGIVEVSNRRRYLVRLDDGRQFWRNRRLLRPV
eukprot:maker-scaffold1127_size61050-snap-gene-0.11 protein:Tk04743 transcript:maker-scaffold1127_size61050-snap-gene-0.11-mRNA-1 annotation:"hypothetical protein DAPPUDRAFT_256239"